MTMPVKITSMAVGSAPAIMGLGLRDWLPFAVVSRGVTRISSSVSDRFQRPDLNRVPSTGMSPSQGSWRTALT
jgi:hypothetical protein